jgi:hypothetical protein
MQRNVLRLGRARSSRVCKRACANADELCASSSQGVSDTEMVAGLWALLENASIPKDLILACESALVSLGAVNVAEVTKDDWQHLPVWSHLRPLQQRRVLATVS